MGEKLDFCLYKRLQKFELGGSIGMEKSGKIK